MLILENRETDLGIQGIIYLYKMRVTLKKQNQSKYLSVIFKSSRRNKERSDILMQFFEFWRQCDTTWNSGRQSF